METRKFRLYNQTRQSGLESDIILVDASEERIEALIENLAFRAGAGLWLKPFRELPTAEVLPLFDVVYLNEENAVIQEVELYPGLAAGPLTTQAASALVLPMGSIVAAQIQAGDQLSIRTPEQMESMPGVPSSQTAPEPVAEEAVAPPEEPQSKDVPPPPLPDERTWQLQNAIRQLNEEHAASQVPKKDSLKTRFLRWLDADRNPEPVDRRHARRSPLPGLVAFYWTGGNPKPHHLGDISESGVYLLTPDRSFPGTIILMTLQRTDSDGEHLGDAISVYGEVVRWGADGVGLQFILSKPAGHEAGHTLIGNPADHDTLIEFLEQLNLPPRGPQR